MSTWILPVTTAAPRWVTGEHDSLAVRISAHPLVVALCQAWGAPLLQHYDIVGMDPRGVGESLAE